MKKYIGVDIGGTNIKYGLVIDNGDVTECFKMPTEAEKGPLKIMDNVLNIISTLEKQYEKDKINGIAISTAGQVDSKKGSIIFANDKMPGYTGFNVKEYLENKTSYRVEVENDVNCAMLAEMWIGNAKDVDNAIMITIGTGIGGAICINNKLYKGSNGIAGECGYMRMETKTFQEEAATSSIINKAKEKLNLNSLDGETLFKLSETNKQAKIIVDEFYDNLAKGISNLIYILDVRKVILGGAIASRKDFKSELNKKIHKYLLDNYIKDDLITIAKLENTAGIVGAVFSFKNSL